MDKWLQEFSCILPITCSTHFTNLEFRKLIISHTQSDPYPERRLSALGAVVWVAVPMCTFRSLEPGSEQQGGLWQSVLHQRSATVRSDQCRCSWPGTVRTTLSTLVQWEYRRQRREHIFSLYPWFFQHPLSDTFPLLYGWAAGLTEPGFCSPCGTGRSRLPFLQGRMAPILPQWLSHQLVNSRTSSTSRPKLGLHILYLWQVRERKRVDMRTDTLRVGKMASALGKLPGGEGRRRSKNSAAKVISVSKGHGLVLGYENKLLFIYVYMTHILYTYYWQICIYIHMSAIKEIKDKNLNLRKSKT